MSIDSVAFARLLDKHGANVSFAFVWELTPLIGLTMTIGPDTPASGTEAGTGETKGLDPKGDGPPLEERDAQTPIPSSRERK